MDRRRNKGPLTRADDARAKREKASTAEPVPTAPSRAGASQRHQGLLEQTRKILW